MSVIRLTLLGSLELTRVGGTSVSEPLRRSKRVALLAYLAAARPRGFHRRDKLAALFWSELPTDRARAALRTTLARLRAEYGDEVLLGSGADEVAVEPAAVLCDVVEFDTAVAALQFEKAAGFYRGPFLDGVHVEGAGEDLETWISTERSRLQAAVLRALAAASTAAEERSDPAGALDFARRALEVSPNDEVAGRRVIALTLAAGNRGEAMRAYDDLARRLRDEFDVEPADETQAMIAGARERGMGATSGHEPAMPSSAVARRTPAVPAPTTRRRAAVFTAVGLVVVLLGALWIATRPKMAPPPIPSVVAVWREVQPADVGARASSGSRAVLDSTGDALLVFGGIADVRRRALVDIGKGYWRLRGFGEGSGTSWARVETADGPRPSPRWIFGVSYSASFDRVILHGGALGFTSPCAADTWVLDHASGIGHVPAWTRVRERGVKPPARAGFQQVFDATRRRLIVFAGHDCVYPNFDDTWVLAFDDSTMSSGTWTLLAPDSSAGIPRARDNYVATYDSVAGRLFVFGGRASARPTDELWALEHASGTGGVPAWHPVRCSGNAPVNSSAASAFDRAADEWIFFGGTNAAGQVTRAVWRVTGLARDIPHCRWEQVTVSETSPAGRSGASAALLSAGRGMLVFGGEFGSTPLADAWVLKIVEKKGGAAGF